MLIGDAVVEMASVRCVYLVEPVYPISPLLWFEGSFGESRYRVVSQLIFSMVSLIL